MVHKGKQHRKITATGKDITDLSPKEREEKIKESGFVPQTPTTGGEGREGGGGIFTSFKSGRPSGIELPDGRTFLGLSPDEVEEIAKREGLKLGEGGKLPLISEQITGSEKLEAARTLEEAGGFEEVTPSEVELSPDLKTDIAVLTPTLGAASQIAAPRSLIGIARDRGWLGDLIPKVRTGEEAFPIPETPETLREAALRQISTDAFNIGTSKSEKFGAFIEDIPLGGDFLARYVGGIVEAPFANAKAIEEEILALGTEATNNQEKTRSGIMVSSYALFRGRQMEDDLAALEGRLKLLINESKILQADTDKVNVIQQKILETKERVDNFRQAARFAAAADLTGTRVLPTDEQIFFELKETNEKK